MNCPYLNGTAVYKARSLYDFYEPHFCYNDVALCQTSNSNKNSTAFDATIDGSGLGLSDNSVTVYPNPATNHITLIFSDALSEEVIFTLQDITSKVQKEVFVAKGSNYKQIPLQQLDRGIYIYTCSTNKEIMAQGKLTIQ
jgi:hypothetical protein